MTESRSLQSWVSNRHHSAIMVQAQLLNHQSSWRKFRHGPNPFSSRPRAGKFESEHTNWNEKGGVGWKRSNAR